MIYIFDVVIDDYRYIVRSYCWCKVKRKMFIGMCYCINMNVCMLWIGLNGLLSLNWDRKCSN